MLKVRPTTWQQDLLLNESRVKVACCGRRSGKTVGGMFNLYYQLQQRPDMKAWYVALSYSQAKRLMWKPLVDGPNALFHRDLIKQKSISELKIELVTGAEITLLGGDNIDSLLGDSLDYLHIDEMQSQKADNWEKLRPMLSDRKGTAFISGTPRGYNHFYDMWFKGWHENKSALKTYNSWQIKTIDAGTITETEIEAAKMELSPSMFEQEYNASFQTLAGRVYSLFDNKMKQDGGSLCQKEDHGGTLMIGMDFNVNPMTATINIKDKGILYTIDEIHIENANTAQMIDAIKNKYNDSNGNMTRNIVIYPDPSGAARKTSAALNSTDHTLLRDAGFDVNVKSKAPYVSDRVNEVNALLLNAKEQRRWFIHPRCQMLIKSLLGLTYLSNGDIDKKSGLDHMMDGVGYLIDIEYPINTGGTVSSFSLY